MKNMSFVLARSALAATLMAIALAIIAGCATQPAPVASTDAGRLMIKRNFSMAGLPAILWVDDVRTAQIDFNRDYDAPIAVGPHTLKLTRVPGLVSDISVPTHLVVQKGVTYKFAAGMQTNKIMLLQ